MAELRTVACSIEGGLGPRLMVERVYFLIGFAAAGSVGSVNGKNLQAGLLLRKLSAVIPTAPGPGPGAAGSARNRIPFRKGCPAAVAAGPNSRFASRILRT